MNPIRTIFGALQAIAQHPVNRHRKWKAVAEYGFIQVAARLVPGDVCVPFPNGTRLLVPPKMKGAAHYIAPRLCEFREMSFVMHFLRKGELFADVGANIGAFSILAAGVAQAEVLAFEPSVDTFEVLGRNIRVNGLQDRVTAVNAAVGRGAGTVSLSHGMGTENCVSSGGASGSDTVKLTSLDAELGGRTPDLLKIDVEGYETEVFAGGRVTFENPSLRAIIIERGNSGNRYGFDENVLHQQIRERGFVPCGYDPLSRRLFRVEDHVMDNIIYVRDFGGTVTTLRTAPAFHLEEIEI